MKTTTMKTTTMTNDAPSLKPSLRQRAPLLVGLAFAIVGATIGWLWIREDVYKTERAGQRAGGYFRFMVSLALLGGLGAHFVTRRILFGQGLTRDEWTLVLDSVDALPELTVADLRKDLEARGYQPLFTVGPLHDPERRADETTRLLDNPITVRDRRTRHGQMCVRFSRATAQAPAWGDVVIDDIEKRTYEEMAMFTIAALAPRLPGLQHKRSFSNLDADRSADLAGQLPDRPVCL